MNLNELKKVENTIVWKSYCNKLVDNYTNKLITLQWLTLPMLTLLRD